MRMPGLLGANWKSAPINGSTANRGMAYLAKIATSSDYSTSSTCTQFVCAYPSIIPTDALCCKKVCMCKSDVPSFAKDPTAGKMLTRDADGVPRPDRCADPVAACSLPK